MQWSQEEPHLLFIKEYLQQDLPACKLRQRECFSVATALGCVWVTVSLLTTEWQCALSILTVCSQSWNKKISAQLQKSNRTLFSFIFKTQKMSACILMALHSWFFTLSFSLTYLNSCLYWNNHSTLILYLPFSQLIYSLISHAVPFNDVYTKKTSSSRLRA